MLPLLLPLLLRGTRIFISPPALTVLLLRVLPALLLILLPPLLLLLLLLQLLLQRLLLLHKALTHCCHLVERVLHGAVHSGRTACHLLLQLLDLLHARCA